MRLRPFYRPDKRAYPMTLTITEGGATPFTDPEALADEARLARGARAASAARNGYPLGRAPGSSPPNPFLGDNPAHDS